MSDPIIQLTAWLNEAKAHPGILEPTACCLATTTPDGKPSARMVLLKGADARGLVFYTNKESRKGEELMANPHAAMCFYWAILERQLRVEGEVSLVDEAEADAYFAGRPRISQLGAWASNQSRLLDARKTLMRRVRELENEFNGKIIPRPPYWMGFRLVPQAIEFWSQGEYRLHDREIWRRDGGGWRMERAYP